MPDQITVHATCVVVDGKGVLLRGPSGAGKSDLALRLIEKGCLLVSDDQVVLSRKNQQIIASPPPSLAGLLEVRGVGICSFDYVEHCDLAVIFDLGPGIVPERMPEISSQQHALLGVDITLMQLDPFQASAAAKVQAALRLIVAKHLLA